MTQPEIGLLFENQDPTPFAQDTFLQLESFHFAAVFGCGDQPVGQAEWFGSSPSSSAALLAISRTKAAGSPAQGVKAPCTVYGYRRTRGKYAAIRFDPGETAATTSPTTDRAGPI